MRFNNSCPSLGVKAIMQIQLKQAEIVTALKQYISSQGINLQNKTVNISFTAGRRESGITADLEIEDTRIPGFDNEDYNGNQPAVQLAYSNSEPVQAAVEVPTEADPAPEVVDEPLPEQAPEPEVPKPTTSLFS